MSDFLVKAAVRCEAAEKFSVESQTCRMASWENVDAYRAQEILRARRSGACQRCIVMHNLLMQQLHQFDRLNKSHVVPRTYRSDPCFYHKVLVLDAEAVEKTRGNGFCLPIHRQLVVAIGGPGCWREGEREVIDCLSVADDPSLLAREDMWFTAYRSEVLGVANLDAILYYLKSYVFHNYKNAFVNELCRLQSNIIKLGGDVSCLPFVDLIKHKAEFQEFFQVV